jgi:hypothetical protein
LFFVLMNFTKVLTSGDNYNVLLYNSPLFENRMTYNLNV